MKADEFKYGLSGPKKGEEVSADRVETSIRGDL